MARHRKRPESRHQAQGRDGATAAPGAPDRRLSLAMRRVVVTPTFAAGLGVVVAAMLVYPMQAGFSSLPPYPGRPRSLPCPKAGTLPSAQRGVYTLHSRTHITTPI